MNRPLWHYALAMNVWLTSVGLSDFEKSIVERLRDAAEKDEASFWDAVEESRLYLSEGLHGAIRVGLADSRLKTWLRLFNFMEEESVNAAA